MHMPVQEVQFSDSEHNITLDEEEKKEIAQNPPSFACQSVEKRLLKDNKSPQPIIMEPFTERELLFTRV